MVNILGFDIPFNAPSFGIGTGNIIWVLIIFIFACVIAIGIYVIYQFRVFKYRVVVFENISGQGFQPSIRDRARLISIGKGGEEVLYLKKKKVYRTAYGRKMGKNTFWFAVGQDGYWYNFLLGDLDAKRGILDIEVVDRDMRYMHVAIGRNLDATYKKQKFLEKYGTIMMSGFFLLIMIIGIYFLLDKMGEISSSSNQAIESSKAVVSAVKDILVSMDNICVGGSGIKPAPT
jgi:hypothetical protein